MIKVFSVKLKAKIVKDLFATTAILITSFWGATSAVAVPVLDQSTSSCCTSGFGFGTQYGAQTFTAGLTGTLAWVNVDLITLPSGTIAPVTFQIRDTSGGVPGSNIFGETTLVGNSFTFSDPITFSSEIDILAGQKYTIVAHSDTTSLNWFGNDNDILAFDSYPGGDLWQSPLAMGSWFMIGGQPGRGDFGFQTFVEPISEPIPEPTTMALLGIGLAGLGGRYLRRRKKKAIGGR